jgi:hypothetical protein
MSALLLYRVMHWAISDSNGRSGGEESEHVLPAALSLAL